MVQTVDPIKKLLCFHKKKHARDNRIDFKYYFSQFNIERNDRHWFIAIFRLLLSHPSDNLWHYLIWRSILFTYYNYAPTFSRNIFEIVTRMKTEEICSKTAKKNFSHCFQQMPLDGWEFSKPYLSHIWIVTLLNNKYNGKY